MRAFPHLIAEVRGVGLMLGLRLKVSPQRMVTRLREGGLLTVASAGDNVIRLVPPLIIGEVHAEEALRIITTVCREWK
jgi:acetylornithine/N-succinyldiaminopimelate aminotransferase